MRETRRDYREIVHLKKDWLTHPFLVMLQQMNPSSRGAFGALNVEDYDDGG